MTSSFTPGDIVQFKSSYDKLNIWAGVVLSSTISGLTVQMFIRAPSSEDWRKQGKPLRYLKDVLELVDRGDLSDEIYALAMSTALRTIDT